MANGVGERIHVCIVTTAHPLDDKRVNAKVAQTLCSEGFQVSWVGPGHSAFDQSHADRDGMRILVTHANRGRIDRLLAARRLRRRLRKVNNVDVYYAPDPDSAPIALEAARRNGARVIFDIHEIYHGALLDRWLFGMRLPMVREYVRRRISHMCSKCDLVVGVSAAVLDSYIDDSARRLVVRSCAPKWFADQTPADVMGPGRTRFRLMHGMSSMQRGTAAVLAAVEIAVREVPETQVVMLTSGPPEQDPSGRAAMAMAHKHGTLNSLELREGVPIRKMPELLRTCDVGLIAYGRDLGVDSLPNRLFEYMAAGLPIVAPRYSKEIAKVVNSEGCGLLADFEDPSSIAAAIVQLHRDPEACQAMGRRGREAFLRRHNWEVEVQPMLERVRSWFPERAVR